ncbi:uncharacterized protein LOC111909844 [Lactuca sativa]|uniref:Uncharacterized protein n=1 Tax=Lactuca virosa TaxID=75947 RepID=A0AAU9LGQ2_9ASTR|nr:uncharacterized protein LOC111909844 [Lactuca sativa]CAH1413502.1 unnamed protein product [Lactuca virosa]
MATLQKFKLLATQCALAGSPSRSPATSPVIHLRRRKTLRMLLSRRLPRREEFLDRRGNNDVDSSDNRKDVGGVRQKLKDLLVSSPPSPRLLEQNRTDGGEETKRWSGGGVRRGGSRGLRPLSGTLRQRLLRRAWRPVLGTIPE